MVVKAIEEIIFRIIFVILYILFAIPRIYYRRKASKAKQIPTKQPPKTSPLRSWAHTAITISILGLLIAYLLYLLIPPWIPWVPLPFPAILRWIGLPLGLAAIPLLIWTHRTLGHYYSPEIEIQKQHLLIKTGPYSRIRHPMYVVFILITFGTILLAANLFVTIFGLLICFLLYPISKQEEQILIKEFGDQYREYMKHTGRFLPPYRRKQELSNSAEG
ncbi:MAG: methyltransferase family protein [Candidatus Thorarchaeota archaeon]